MFESWLILFVILIIIEMATVNLLTVWFAVGSLIAAVVSLFTDSMTVQLAVFVISSAITLLLTKPIVKKIRNKEIENTNLDRVLGKLGIVTEEIDYLEPGEVKVDGKRWTAIANEKIDKGSKVEILSIDGVKLNVKKVREEK